MCANIGGVAKLTQSNRISDLALLCPSTQIGNQLSAGNFGGAISTALGMGMGQVSSALKTRGGPAGYLAGVAIDVYSYGFSEFSKSDFSQQTLGSTIAYAAANPAVLAQETVKAVGIVASNIWSAFIPW
ncbi:hypothetical protein GCM10007304_48840 [Rhodococcoides trifolii]|uniref:Uncharacterized protein n=1 Tax=Rhodococcoides trifolii TaxID=908250 RepID=A0A917G9C9_9NOCA|nr:hypothetical protein GCM10007304_48840 [Rhodococcus trifolii]